MNSPKLICKSGYIKNLTRLLNTLEYAGNKIAAQHVVFKDGSTAEVDPEARIVLTKTQQAEVSYIRMDYKDGGGKDISYEKYSLFTKQSSSSMRVHELKEVQDDSVLLVNSDGKAYHSIESLDFFSYLPYIAERPGVEKEDSHGLFGVTGNVDIEDAKAMAIEYESSIKWSHIVSLDAQAAADAGFDCRAAWKNLITAKAPQIAKAYHISLENLVINAAYHGNTDNPHCHLIFYSKSRSEGYIHGGESAMQKASEKLKSLFYNDIFKFDVHYLEVGKSQQRDAMRKEINKHLQNCLVKDYGRTELTGMLAEVSKDISALTGKINYGYLPQPLKIKVDDILRWTMEHDEDMSAMFSKYCNIQRDFITGYVVNPRVVAEKLEKFKSEFFHPKKDNLRIYHNVIVQCAHQLNGMLLPADERTAEEEITDFVPLDNDLSSKITFLSDDSSDITLPGDDDAPPETTDEFAEGDFYVPDNELPFMGNPKATIIERTAEGEINDITPLDDGLSSAAVGKILKGKGKKFGRLYQLMFQNRGLLSDFVNTARKELKKSWDKINSPEAHKLEQLMNDVDSGTAQIENATAEVFKLINNSWLEFGTNTYIEALTKKLESTCEYANMRLELESRIGFAMHHGEKASPVNFMLQSFCKNLKAEHIKFVLREAEAKEKVKDFRSHLYKSLCRSVIRGDAEISKAFSSYEKEKNGKLQLDAIFKMLSTPEYDFIAQKDKLCEYILSQLEAKGVNDVSQQYAQTLDDLFYREGDDKYDTMNVRRTVETVISCKDEIIAQYNFNLCAKMTVMLFRGIARLLAGQVQNANRCREDEHSFSGKQQFKNRRQFSHQSAYETPIAY